MKLTRIALAASLVVVASFVSRNAESQSLAGRIASARDGKVRFTFASKPEVCGGGNWISTHGNDRTSWSSDYSPDVIYDEECSHSPVRIVLFVDQGRVTKLRTYVGGRWRPVTEGVTDLGTVSARDATSYLLTLASNDEGSAGREAILPVTLADSVNVWPQLFRLARDETKPSGTRKQAIFWLGQAAGDVVAPGRSERGRETDEQQVKKQAVFALSQRRNGEAVPTLIQVVKNNRDPEVRRTAMFWLGQSGDPRAVDLFEQILTR